MSTSSDLPPRIAAALAAHPRPVMAVDPDAPLRAGDLRRLDPLPGDTEAEPMLVLVATDPTVDDLPDDITYVPGPCHILHVIPVESPHEYATSVDILLPTEATGTPFALHAIMDMFSTIRLDPDDPNGRRRFGPKIGNTLPRELGALGWVADLLSHHELADRVEELGYRLGDVPVQSGDWLWGHRIRLCRNLNRLNGWW